MSKYLIDLNNKLKEDFKIKCLINKSTMKKKIVELIGEYTYGRKNVSKIDKANKESLEKH